MNRRNALKSGLVLASASSFLPKSIASKKTEHSLLFERIDEYYACLVKKGHPRNDEVFSYCVMNVQSYPRVKSDIEDIFTKFNYKTELKYASSDRYKVKVANAIFDYINISNDIKFDIVIFKSRPSDFIGIKPSEYDALTNGWYRNIGFRYMSSSNITMKAEDKFGPSEKFKNDFAINHSKTVDFITANSDRLIQVNDFMAGCVVAIKSKKKIESSIKNALFESFQSKFELNASLENETKEKFKIKVIEV